MNMFKRRGFKTIHFWLIVFLAVSGFQFGIAVLRKAESASINKFSGCAFNDGLQIVKVTPFPDSAKIRIVKTNGGQKKIYLINGVRLKYAYPHTDIFANVFVEQADPSQYSEDKKVALENLRYLASNTTGISQKEPTEKIYSGLTSFSIERQNIGGYFVVGENLFFLDPDKIIVTIDFLDQKAKNRKFQTIEEWRVLKERFLTQFSKCLTTK